MSILSYGVSRLFLWLCLHMSVSQTLRAPTLALLWCWDAISLQLLLTFDPVLVEKVATLLYLVIEDNPGLSRLYLSGAFFFIMMYTGSNVLPIARFLKYTHLKQAFRSDEVNMNMLFSGWLIFLS